MVFTLAINYTHHTRDVFTCGDVTWLKFIAGRPSYNPSDVLVVPVHLLIHSNAMIPVILFLRPYVCICIFLGLEIGL